MTMEFDLEGRFADRAYAMLASLVTPRPIAWVTTVNLEGVVNAAPLLRRSTPPEPSASAKPA